MWGVMGGRGCWLRGARGSSFDAVVWVLENGEEFRVSPLHNKQFDASVMVAKLAARSTSLGQ